MQGWRRLLAAGGAALLAYVVSAGCVLVLMGGTRGRGNGVLWSVFERTVAAFRSAVGARLPACPEYIALICWLSPPMLLALAIFAWLLRGKRRGDGFLHCLRCGYILKGLAEPRCPECGEPI